MIEGHMVRKCCFVEQQTLLYSQPGDHILYHRKEVELQCKKGWTGDNCDACASGWTSEDCDTCTPGRLPPDCSTCRFGFSTESNCTVCIQNGYWKGSHSSYYLDVHLTFTGDTCSDWVLGRFLSMFSF